MKSFLTEVTTDSNRAKAFSYLSFGVSIGAILGPLIGGYLSFASDKYPSVFPPSDFDKFPSLLPALCCFSITIITTLYCYMFMQETCPNIVMHNKSVEESSGKGDVELTETSLIQPGTLSSSSPAKNKYDNLSDTPDLESGEIRRRRSSSASLRIITDPSGYLEMVDEDDEAFSPDQPLDRVSPHTNNPILEEASFSSEKCLDDIQTAQQIMDMEKGTVVKPKKESFNVFKNKSVLLATSNYGLLCFSFILMDETIPFLLRSPVQEGGMDFSSSDIGFVLSISGLPMLVFVLFYLAKVVSGSKKQAFSRFVCGSIFIAALWPLLGAIYKNRLYQSGGAKDILMACTIILAMSKHIFSTVCFTSVIVMVNNSVENKFLGQANGFGQSLASAARAIGPLIGGIGWSLGTSIGFSYFNFVVICMMLFGNVCLCQFLPNSIDYKKKSREEELLSKALKKHSSAPTIIEENQELGLSEQ